MSAMGSKGWRSLGYCRLLGQDYSAALAFHVFGEQQFLAHLKMEHQGEGWWGEDHLPLEMVSSLMLLQVLRVSPGFDLAGICPLVNAIINWLLPQWFVPTELPRRCFNPRGAETEEGLGSLGW